MSKVQVDSAELETLRKKAALFDKLKAAARTEGHDGGWSGVWVLPNMDAWNDSPNPEYAMKRRSFEQAVELLRR